MDVRNVFNIKQLNFAGFSSNYDYVDYLESLRFSWEEGDQKGDDRLGEYRPNGVDFDPLEANPTNDPAITARNNDRISRKSYIDMPDVTSVTFLNPRSFTFGLRFSF